MASLNTHKLALYLLKLALINFTWMFRINLQCKEDIWSGKLEFNAAKMGWSFFFEVVLEWPLNVKPNLNSWWGRDSVVSRTVHCTMMMILRLFSRHWNSPSSWFDKIRMWYQYFLSYSFSTFFWHIFWWIFRKWLTMR